VQSPTICGDGEGKKPKLDELEYEEAPSSEIEKPHNIFASEDEDAGPDPLGRSGFFSEVVEITCGSCKLFESLFGIHL
jgi:hypothetical protein